MTYDPTTPPVRQTDSWSCSVASAAWMLHSLGLDVDYHDLERRELADGIVSEQKGLEVGGGGPLADWLAAEYSLTMGHSFAVTWEWLLCHAGFWPIAMGSGSLYHWVAVADVTGEMLLLSNPAPGYRGLYDSMTEAQFNQWAPWACVYIETADATEEDDPVKLAAAENTIDYLKGDVADAFESAIVTLEQTPRLPQAARDAVASGLRPALETLRRGGPPE